MVTVEIPAGSRVSLRPGEWTTHLGVLGATYLDVRAVRVGGTPVGLPDWVWVRGHALECAWESVACAHTWCVKVAVRQDVLAAAVDR